MKKFIEIGKRLDGDDCWEPDRTALFGGVDRDLVPAGLFCIADVFLNSDERVARENGNDSGDAKLDGFDVSKLPTDKGAALILACNGAECWKSYKASHAAVKAGYTKVYWFRGGIPEWRSAGKSVAALP